MRRRTTRTLLEPNGWTTTGAPDRPRILLEHPDDSEAWALARILTNAGFDVATCSGPQTCASRTTDCPLLAGRECRLIEAADAVVSSSYVADSESIVGAIGTHRPELPIFVEAPRNRAGRYRALQEQDRVVPLASAPREIVVRLTTVLDLE